MAGRVSHVETRRRARRFLLRRPADLSAGQPVDYVIKPAESQKYRIETKRASDALLVLFEDIDGEPRYLSGDDDSAQDRHAVIEDKLFAGRTYVARLRGYTDAERPPFRRGTVDRRLDRRETL